MQILAVIVFGILVIAGVTLVMSFPLMLLWNGCLVGAVAGVNEVGWLQMWGLAFLLQALFKGTSVETKKD